MEDKDNKTTAPQTDRENIRLWRKVICRLIRLMTCILNFIEKNELGEVLPETVRSSYGGYAKVAFRLDRLQEFDPEGVARYRASHPSLAPSPQMAANHMKMKR